MVWTDRPRAAHRRTISGEAIVRRVLVEYRFVISLALAGIVSGAGLHVWPFPSDHPPLELIEAHRPMIDAGFSYWHVTVPLQGLRTKVFLALSDDFSAHIAAELSGKVERLKPVYTLSEAGQDARVSVLTGRPAAHRTTVSAAKTYKLSLAYVFEPRAFTELQNAQARVSPCDGFNPQPPTRCYLKPYYLDPQVFYFDQVAAGAL
jgi:hypothetical protein